MIKKKPLPAGIIEVLHKSQITKEEVVSYAYVDMNIGCEFVKSYLVLTKDTLVFAEGQPNKENVFIFGNQKEDEDEKLLTEFKLKVYPVNDIEKLKISTQIRTGLLYAEGKHTELLSYFTIGRYPEVLQLVTDFNRIKNMPDRKSEQMEGGPQKGNRRPDFQAMEGMPKGKQHKKTDKASTSTAVRLFGYLKPHKIKLFVLLLSYLAIAGCNLVWPYLSGTVLYDQVLSKNPDILKQLKIGNNDFVFALGLVVIGMVCAKLLIMLFTAINSLINTHMNQKIIMEMRNDVFESMGQLSLRYFQSAQTGTLMVRVLQDAGRVSRLLVDEMPHVLINAFTIVSTVIVMVGINAKLAIISLIPLPLIFYISAKMRPRMHVLFGKRHRAERRMTTSINDSITGVRVVKVFGKENEEIKKFSFVNEDVQNVEREIIRFAVKFNSVYWVANELTTLLIWGVGSYFILSGHNITYGILMTFAGYISQLNRPLNDLIRIFRQWVDSMNAAERLFEIIDANPEIVNKPEPIDLRNAKGDIEIDNITFGYEPNMPVFSDFSLKVQAGKMLGIVGRSGAGKTTLVNIISRLYEVEKGSIRIDGIDIRDISLESLRKNIAMVSQETYIFMGTIAENIAYAKPDATREEIINAAIMASAHEFICSLPEGYDTVIGASGRSLSGGERQRLSIARAVLADPKILILDEATASVDTKTERAIQASLAELSKNRTTLSIAHRLSTLKSADYLIVLEHGKIIEEGTHKELIEKNGTYCMLKELQTNALALKGLE